MKSIEMIGLCGVGKTSLLYSDKNPLKNDVKIVEPIVPARIYVLMQLALLYGKMFLRAPVSAIYILYDNSWRSLLLKLAYRIAGVKMRKQNNRDWVFLRDSGVLMPIITAVIDNRLSYFYYPIGKLIQSLPLPEKVICVLDDDVEAVYRRFVIRESLMQRDLKLHTLDVFIKASEFIDHLMLELTKNKIDLVCIYNGHAQKENIGDY